MRISKIYGNLQGLRSAEIRRLERLYRKKSSPNHVVTPDLARRLCEISWEIKRQVGLLIDRRGKVYLVLVGDHQKVEIPALQGFRKSPARLIGLRLVHTHLREEPLSRDDLVDLAHLRLDFVCEIQVQNGGIPGRIQAAHLLPANPQQRQWEVIEAANPSLLDVDAMAVASALEEEFTRILRAGSVDGRGERAVLVGVYPTSGDRSKRSMEELRELSRSSGLQVLDTVMQFRAHPDPRFVLGKGKVEELILRSKQIGAEIIIFDCNLDPGQLRNLTNMTDQKIIDRTQLILDIFAQHAHSRDGRIQVELAQLKYLLPRLVGKNPALSRLRGGIGLRGPGETKLEVDRRRVWDRIRRLEAQLDRVRNARSQRRARRNRFSLPIISIVGYTNAGKSTLLNALTHSDVAARNKLFATLDPATRRLRFPRERDVIITDTVGFIKDLPPDLINAFRATLEELKDADLLVHVADISNPFVEEQIQSVEKILTQMDLHRTPCLLVFNKTDLVEPEQCLRMVRRHRSMAISARKGIGIQDVSKRVQKIIFDGAEPVAQYERCHQRSGTDESHKDTGEGSDERAIAGGPERF